MAKYTRVNGAWASKRGRESGKVFSVTPISVSGSKAKQTATVFINGKMGIDTKASGVIVLSTAKALTSSQTETYSQVLTNRASPKVWASTSGKMEVST